MSTFRLQFDLSAAIAAALDGGSGRAEYDELGPVWQNYLNVAPGRVYIESRHRSDDGLPFSVYCGLAHRFKLPSSWREPTWHECMAIATAVRAYWAAEDRDTQFAAKDHVCGLLAQLQDCPRPLPDGA